MLVLVLIDIEKQKMCIFIKILKNKILYYMYKGILLGTKKLHPGVEWRIFRMSRLGVT